MKKVSFNLFRFRFRSFDLSILMPIAFVVILAMGAIIGCGKGGGGGGNPGLNPLGAGTPEAFADLSGTVTFNGAPMADSAVYLIKPETALNSGVSQVVSLRQSVGLQNVLENSAHSAAPSIIASASIPAATSSTPKSAVIPNSDYGEYRTISNEAGEFRFTNIKTGEYTLVAVKNANQQAIRTGVVVGAITTVDVQLTPTGNLTGKITVPGLSDMTGTLVFLEGTSFVGLTSSDGAFTLLNIPAGNYNLRAQRSGFATLSPISVQVAPAVTSSIADQTLSAVSVPLNQGGITGSAVRKSFLPGDSTHAGTIVLLSGTAFLTLTDSSGLYAFTGISTGSYKLMFPSDQYSADSNPTVVVVAGQVASAPIVNMTPKNSGLVRGNLDGRGYKSRKVLGQTDESGIIAQLASSSGSFLAITDSVGLFQFRQIPIGSYELSFKSELYKPASVTPIIVSVLSSSSPELGLFGFTPIDPNATDTTAPVVKSFSPGNASFMKNNAGGFFMVTFSQNVFKGTAGNIDIKRTSDGSIIETIPITDSKVNISGAYVTISPSIVFPDASYYFEIAPTCLRDISGNYFAGIAGAAVWSFTVDTIQPTVSALTTTAPNPTNNSPIPVTVTFSEPVQEFSLWDVSGSNIMAKTNLQVVIASRSWTFDVEPWAGTVTVNIATGQVYDLAGNFNIAATPLVRKYDAATPTVSLTSTSSNTTNDKPIIVKISFNKEVTGFDINDVVVGSATASNLQMVTTNREWTVDVAPATEGVIIVQVPAGAANDLAGNPSNASSQLSRTYDSIKPSAVLSTTSSSPTKSFIPVKITFSENVTGFSSSDLIVANGGKQNFTGSGKIYNVTISPTGASVTVDIATGAAQDSAGNDNTAAEQLFRVYDNQGPTTTLSSTASTTTNLSPFSVTISFSEDVTGFAQADISISNGSLSNVQGGPATYTVDVTPTANQNVTVGFTSNKVIDAAGNYNSAATSLVRRHDNINPSVGLSTAVGSSTNSSPFSVTITFSEDVTGFTSGDISVGNGSVNSLSGGPQIYTAQITPGGQTVSVDIPSGGAQDDANNPNTVASQLQVTYETTAPSVVLSSMAPATVIASFSVTITFDEDVNGFTVDDLSVGNGAADNLAVVTANRVWSVDITPTVQGAVTVDLAAGKAKDLAGNNNTAAGQLSKTYNPTKPTVSITTTASDPTNLANIPINITFSENVDGFIANDLVLTNCTVSNFICSVASTVWICDATPDGDGVLTIDLPADSALNSVGNGNSAASTLSVESDRTAPSALLSADVSNATTSSIVTVTITFDEDVFGFDENDVFLTNASKGAFTDVTPNQVWTLQVIPSGNGLVDVTIPVSMATDSANNSNSLSQLSWTYAGFNFTTIAGISGTSGSADGGLANAMYSYPFGLAIFEASNSIFVADRNNHTIRKINSGTTSTVAGLAGQSGNTDGASQSARFFYPSGLAVASSGDLFVADTSNHTIRKLTFDSTGTATVSIFAGLPGISGYQDGTGGQAQFNSPAGIAVADSGDVYVADTGNHTIRKITPAGIVTTFAGSAGNPGTADGSGDSAQFNNPIGLTINGSGDLYVADTNNHTIRFISAGVVSTLAGQAGTSGSQDGTTGADAGFNLPTGVAVNSAGDVYVADKGNHIIRRIYPTGEVTTIGGSAGVSGSVDSFGQNARFNLPYGIAVDSSNVIYIGDTLNHLIRQGDTGV